VNFDKDQIIFREGDTHNQFYIIVTGKVSLEITMPGRVYQILVVEDGGELGWSFMLAEGGKHFQARALQRVCALAFDGGQLQKACGEDAALGYRLMSRVLRVVSSRLQATRLHFLDFHFPETTPPKS
jgi:CRP/FNR family transcriptional regulator, cyclic AMP receptor protein